ncbi:hypothetical protein ARTHRO9AX_10340 [Arthrobacter sp. 9AX]|nr:hypothetical protein ARTHRO9AX_10340 [Arthrobacter sp. 9AX]
MSRPPLPEPRRPDRTNVVGGVGAGPGNPVYTKVLDELGREPVVKGANCTSPRCSQLLRPHRETRYQVDGHYSD